MQKSVFLLLLIVQMPILVLSQHFELSGVVLNGSTAAPLENVNLKIRDSNSGAASDNEGRFKLTLNGFPSVIEISCVGFEPISLEINKEVTTPLEINLQPVIQQLGAVTISADKVVPVYQDRDYSVLDYEIMDDNLLLLVYRYQLKRSVLLLLTRSGDTLSQTLLPEIPPDKLYKDPLGNVHYFSKKGNAYQCYFDMKAKELYFIYKFSVEMVLKTFGDMKFEMNNRLFFQENTHQDYSSKIGYFNKEDGKKYLQLTNNESKAKAYHDDLIAFLEPVRPGDIYSTEAKMRAFELFYKPRSNALMVKAGSDQIAVFDFINDTLELINSDWKILSSSTISFHKEAETNLLTSFVNAFSGNQWKWRSKIYSDEYTGKVYTSFEKHGRIKLSNIDLYNGQINAEYVLPVLFAEKITIYKGEAFFLYKPIGEAEKWKLYKMRL